MGQKSTFGSTATWLFPSLAAIAAVFLAFWLQKAFSEKPDIRFSVSSSISTKMLGTPHTAHIQEVAVFNVGNAAARDVVLTCESGILEYELYRSAETDKIQEYFLGGRLEIRYAELSPGGMFKVVLKADVPLSSYSIGLRHSQGVGRDVFAKADPFRGMLSAIAVFICYMLISGWLTFKNMNTESDARFNPRRILSRGKPWHVRTRKWTEYTSTAIDAYFSKSYIHCSLANLQENVGYKYLTGDSEILELDGEEKSKADKVALENFKDAALYAMEGASGRDEATKILSIVVALQDGDYSDVRIAISKAWVSKMLPKFDTFTDMNHA